MYGLHFRSTPGPNVAFVEVSFAPYFPLALSEVCHAVVGGTAIRFAVSVIQMICVMFYMTFATCNTIIIVFVGSKNSINSSLIFFKNCIVLAFKILYVLVSASTRNC